MIRILPSPHLLWIAALAALLALPTQAQHRQRGDDRRYEQTFEVDRHNERTFRLDETVATPGGERFHVAGDVRVAAHVRGQGADEVQVSGQINGSGVTVTRLRDRRVFRVTGAKQLDRTFRRPDRDRITASTVVDFNLLSQGSEPDYRLYLDLQGEIDRGGELTVRVTDVRVDERGRRGAEAENGGRYERDFRVDTRNARTYHLDRNIVARGGERFNVKGDLRVAATVQRAGDGRLRLTALASGDDLTVTRLDHRQIFDVVGTEEIEQTVREPAQGTASFSTVVNFRLVPARAEHINTDPEHHLYLRLVGDVSRDGDLTLRISDMEIR